MKTLKSRFKFFNSKQSALFLVGIPFVIVTFQLFEETSKTKSESFATTRDSKLFLNSFRAVEADQAESTSQSSGSIFSKIFSGIGSFFVLIGSGFATGITETFKFLGKVIIFPVTGTIALFSRSQETAGGGGGGGGRSR